MTVHNRHPFCFDIDPFHGVEGEHAVLPVAVASGRVFFLYFVKVEVDCPDVLVADTVGCFVGCFVVGGRNGTSAVGVGVHGPGVVAGADVVGAGGSSIGVVVGTGVVDGTVDGTHRVVGTVVGGPTGIVVGGTGAVGVVGVEVGGLQALVLPTQANVA